MIRTLALTLCLVWLAPGPAYAADRRPASEFFSGEVVSFRARRITLRYDLSDPKSLKDFETVNPFRSLARGGFEIRDGALAAEGVGALRHRAEFEADVTVEATLRSPKPQDIGVLLLRPDAPSFLLFGLADTFFSLEDHAEPHQNMITVVGAADRGAKPDETLFRYLRRSLEPSLEAGSTIEIAVRKKGERNRFDLAGRTMDGTDAYGKFPVVQPALYVLDSRMTVTALRISGKVARSWLDANGIVWDPTEKDDQAGEDGDAPVGDLVPVPPEKPEGRGPREGGGPPRWGKTTETGELVKKIADGDLSADERRKAADGLTKENVKADEFRALIDLLYKDDETTRTLAFGVLERITGKTLGYHPKASEDKRRDAIRNWFRYFMDNRERFR